MRAHLKPNKQPTAAKRLEVEIQGAVQGVGFRPFVYRLAKDAGLNGWVSNDSQGVHIEVEGQEQFLYHFLRQLNSNAPPLAHIVSLESRLLPPTGLSAFEIRTSTANGIKTTYVLPDIATCPQCLDELFDPSDRRFRYPFINCTNCGPRYSIIKELPYDRPLTTMRGFVLCPSCEREYSDPGDRRFHAQPTACSRCGPSLQFWQGSPQPIATAEDALIRAERCIQAGKILALKGVGGFQLLVDADNPPAVERLRWKKQRGPKPFALMAPSTGSVRVFCHMSGREESLLCSPAAPIVLLRKRSQIFEHVAPGVRDYGVMLPYSPLHHLIMRDLGCPLVVTSGNRSEEPICIENLDAYFRLSDIADAFLVHDRPIERHVDDSIARVILNREQILRRARGYAPLPISLPATALDSLAVGGHLKNSVAVTARNKAFASQHIGNLDTLESYQAFEKTVADLPRLFDAKPEFIVHDNHPDYLSTLYAKTANLKPIAVQHHLAHVYACMADNKLSPPALGFSWDGSGYGDDGTFWGGETFLVEKNSEKRVASILQFPLIGGDLAAEEPRRMAYALLALAFPEGFDLVAGLPLLRSYSREEHQVCTGLMRSRNVALSSSIGRLFDGVSSIVGLCQLNRFEGQAAMLLEASAAKANGKWLPLPYSINLQSNPYIFDWRAAIRATVQLAIAGEHTSVIANRFHQTLVSYALDIANRFEVRDIVLTGGCLQNRLLCELMAKELETAKFSVHIHQRIPPNDGGLCVGQAYATSRQEKPIQGKANVSSNPG